jgi:hypothetical protein
MNAEMQAELDRYKKIRAGERAPNATGVVSSIQFQTSRFA